MANAGLFILRYVDLHLSKCQTSSWTYPFNVEVRSQNVGWWFYARLGPGAVSHSIISKNVLTSFRYDFEYEDDDDEETGDVGIENKYYNAKQVKVDNPEEAIEEFLGVPALEVEKGDWYASKIQNSRHEGLNVL